MGKIFSVRVQLRIKKGRKQNFEFMSRIYQHLMCNECKFRQQDFPEKMVTSRIY